MTSATLARQNGIEVISVGVGQDVDMGELQGIAGDPSRVYKLTGYDKLAGIATQLVASSCPVNRKFNQHNV